jgi:hypothetical protein
MHKSEQRKLDLKSDFRGRTLSIEWAPVERGDICRIRTCQDSGTYHEGLEGRADLKVARCAVRVGIVVRLHSRQRAALSLHIPPLQDLLQKELALTHVGVSYVHQRSVPNLAVEEDVRRGNLLPFPRPPLNSACRWHRWLG